MELKRALKQPEQSFEKRTPSYSEKRKNFAKEKDTKKQGASLQRPPKQTKHEFAEVNVLVPKNFSYVFASIARWFYNDGRVCILRNCARCTKKNTFIFTRPTIKERASLPNATVATLCEKTVGRHLPHRKRKKNKSFLFRYVPYERDSLFAPDNTVSPT